MEVKITHPSKHLHSTALYNLAPATSLKAVPRLLHGHQLQPHRPFLFFPYTKITPTSECALDGPPPLPGMCFSLSPWGSLPSSLGLLLSGRSSLTTRPLSCFIFFHSIYHHWKHFMNWFIVHAHTHTCMEAWEQGLCLYSSQLPPQHLKPVSTELWAGKHFLINKSMKWRKTILGCKIM